MRLTSLAAALGIAILAACLSPTDGCGCPPAPASAVVSGVVHDSAGLPVAHATVLGYVEGLDGCVARNLTDGLATTDALGRYRLFLAAGPELPATCVLVRARSPLASGPVLTRDTQVTLALRYQPPLDSARWDPLLPVPPSGAARSGPAPAAGASR